MLKNICRNSVNTLLLAVALATTNQQLNAVRFDLRPVVKAELCTYAEVATALLRGTCSKIEHGLKNDDSKKAHLQRTLISALRVTHGLLAINNHANDYRYAYYFERWVAVDGLETILRAISCLQAPAQNTNAAQAAPVDTDADDDFFLALDDEINTDTKQLTAITNATNNRFNFVRLHALPELERWAGVYLALAPNNTPQEKKARFAAKALLSLSRSCQDYWDQEKTALKIAAGSVVLVDLIYPLYELLNTNSGLNTWANGHNPHPQPLPQPQPEPNRMPLHVRWDGNGVVVNDRDPAEACAICLSEWQDIDGDIGITACGHAFCYNCCLANHRAIEQRIHENLHAAPGSEADTGNPAQHICPICRVGCRTADAQRINPADLRAREYRFN